MAPDDPLADGQPHPRAFVLRSRVQTLEDDEDALPVLLFDPDPVVRDAQPPFALAPFRRDGHHRRDLPMELQGVDHEVLEHALDLPSVAHDLGKTLVAHRAARL